VTIDVFINTHLHCCIIKLKRTSKFIFHYILFQLNAMLIISYKARLKACFDIFIFDRKRFV